MNARAVIDTKGFPAGGVHMPVQKETQTNAGLKPKKTETWEFRLIFFASFIVFLAAAILERVLPGSRRGRSAGFHGGKSIIAEAKEAAGTCTAYAFMG